MKLQNGETLLLNGVHYQIQERLGRGAVSDVYPALLDGVTEARVVVKMVRDDAGDDPLKMEALQCEADTLSLLNRAEDPQWIGLADARARFRQVQKTIVQRKVIALLDAGELAPGQPFVVQEIAPAAFERFTIETPADEARLFRIAQATLDVVALAHHNDLSLKDFEPATKGDRIRLQWLDDAQQTFALKVIDWNITGGPELMAQDLFYFGGHLYYWLTGRHVYVDSEGRTPANLGTGNPAWGTLTAGTRQLVAKLLHRDPQRRYASVDVLAADVAWWNEILAQIGASSVFRRLDDRLWQARPAGRYDRVRAIADLALRLNPPADARQSFEQSLKQAQDELDKENWQPIAHAQVTLGTRAYEKAALEFAQQLKILPQESEAARLARIYQSLAGTGALLKQHYQGADERRSPEWETLETRAIPALVQRRWQEAQSALNEVKRLRPETRDWTALNDLTDWAASGARYVGEVTAAFAEAENRADPLSDAWLETEQTKIAAHEAAVEILKTVQNKAPFEPEFKERLNIESDQLKIRQILNDLYTRAAELLVQGQATLQKARQTETSHEYAMAAGEYQDAAQKLESAGNLFQEVLHTDAAQRRAQLYARRVQNAVEQTQSLQQQSTALHQAQQDLAIGNYEQALEHVRTALQLAPGRKDAQGLESAIKQKQQDVLLARAQREIDLGQYAEAQPDVQQVLRGASAHRDAQMMSVEVDAGIQTVEQIRIYLQGATTYLQNDEFDQALAQLSRFERWDGRALRELPGGQALPDAVGARPFHLQADLRNRAATMRQQIETTRDTWNNVQQAIRDNDDAEIISLCEALLERDDSLTPYLGRALTEARRRVEAQQRAAPLIANAQDFKDVRDALQMIESDQSTLAVRLRGQAAMQWQRLAQAQADRLVTEADWQDLLTRLREGQRLFEPQADTFKGMQSLVERVRSLALVDGLAIDARPTWFALQDWPARLARVEEELAGVAAASQSWPALQQLVSGWRTGNAEQRGLLKHLESFLQEQFSTAEALHPQKDVLLRAVWSLWNSLPARTRASLPRASLETFLQKQFNEIRTLSDARNFAAARAGSDALWEGFPETVRGAPPAGLPAETRDFRAQLALRQNGDAVLARVVQQLARDDAYSFQDAAQTMREVTLPEHPNIPTDDLEAVRTELEQAGNLEALAAVTPVADLQPPEGKVNYAQVIHRCRAEALPVLATLEAYPALGGRLAGLRRLLPDKREDTARALEEALNTAVQAQYAAPTTNPDELIGLYQQAWWSQSIALRTTPTDAILKARQLPQHTLQAAAKLLIDIRDLVSFAEPQSLLERAERLNNTLFTYENEELPPLPETVVRAEVGQNWQLSAGSLEQFVSSVSALKTHLTAAVALEAENTTNGHYNEHQVNAARDLARQLKPALERLQGAWTALTLTEWQDTNSLMQLKKEIPDHDTLADNYAEADRLLQANEVMQGLQWLSQHVETPGVLATVQRATAPLLAKPRQALTLNYSALRQDLIAALGKQIAAILPLRDAAEKLQTDVLLMAQSIDIGEAAYQAIREGVALRAAQAQEEGRDEEANRLWKVVLDATEPWADSSLDAAALVDVRGAQPASQQRRQAREKQASKTKAGKPEPYLEQQTEHATLPGAPERRAVPSAKQSGGAKKPTLREG